jgi:hypothetical protein
MHTLKSSASPTCLVASAAAPQTASPEWDARFGDSSRALKAQQLIDPAAPTRNAQTSLADRRPDRSRGEAIGTSKAIRSPPPTNVINIGVGR